MSIIERSLGVRFGAGIARLIVNNEQESVTNLTLDISECDCTFRPSRLVSLRKQHLEYLKSKTDPRMAALTLSEDRTRVSLDLAAGEGGEWGSKLFDLCEEKNIESLN